MTHPPFPQRNGPRTTARLREVPLDDRETAYHGSWSGDAILLGLVIAVLLVNAVIIWNQLGPGQEHVRHALFFGVLLICAYWAALVYTFKLSVSVRVGPHGLAIVRGPWRTELPWREVSRLVERLQTHRQQRYRWVVALARDGRRLQVREDMVLDYRRFRFEVYERFRLWQDHGGTWGATGGGPFTACEVIAGPVTWWGVLAGLFLLPGLYFTLLLPETGPLGPALLLIALVSGALAARVLLLRRIYTVDAKALHAQRPLGAVDLPWRDVARVDRTRHPFGGALEAGITAGRFALALAARTDPRVESFAWYPRVPEYLTLRGSGRQIRIALHRVARPDELLAWIEFYERVGRRSAGASEPTRRTLAPTGRPVRQELPADLSGAAGPRDPWAPAPEQPAAPAAGAASSASGPARPMGRLASAYGDARSASGPLAPAPAPAAPESAQRGYPLHGSGLTGSIDQLWADSRTDLDWQPAAPPEPPAEQPPAAPAPAPDPTRGAWQYPAAPEPQHFDDAEAEDTPAESVESPADMFTPWRTDPHWAPPPLPRFGPPSGPAPATEPEREGEQRDRSFADDEFLR